MADTIQAPTELYFKIQQGATFARTLTWKTGDPLAAVDLSTGFTARMTFRTRWGADALFTLTEIDGLVLGSGTGNIQFEISETNAKLLVPQTLNHVFDIRVVAPDDTIVRPFIGEAKITPWVTYES